MSHFLPAEEMEKIEAELRSATSEFLVASERLEKERNALEKEMITALEEQRVENLKKKLL